MAHEHEYDYSSHSDQVIQDVLIEREIKTSYIDYAMSVIVGRALPDVRDGLKPVHRRILYSMYRDKYTYDKPFRKSATTVGAVLGSFHPHGDSSVYDALVRLAQPFNMRYTLVEGHGNFGNIDGDPAAAYRYTEARMARLADEMLRDIDKDVVDWDPNFDNTCKEPRVLPARFPNLLVNGSIGIAVGMATNIPTHNMNEVCDAVIYMMSHPDCTVPELMQFIKGPDFPTYGTIYGTAGIYEAYMTGKGHVKVRAKAHIEEYKGKERIIITELPYQVNRSMLLENMVQLVKDKRIEGIGDIRNESGRGGMRIVVEVKKEANAQIVLNLLYKYTQLEDTCAINMVALVGGEPKLLGLKDILHYYLLHQHDVIERRTRFELAKAEREAHIYEGLKIAIDHIEEVIRIIRSSASISDAKANLMAAFSLTDVQAQAIVDMTLGRLSGLERQKVQDRLDQLYALIDDLKDILAKPERVSEIIKNDLEDIKKRYGDPRRTTIVEVENEILIEDLIEKQDVVISVTNDGYVKRTPVDTYTAQRRGGKGITAMGTKQEDFVVNMFIAHSHDTMLLFSNLGKLYIKRCFEIPEASRTAKGTNVVNLLTLCEGEKITAVINVQQFTDKENLVMITRNGIVKRVCLMAYKTRRTAGLYAVTLDEGDELLSVLKTDGNAHIICASSRGNAIRFDENDIRLVGRQARGVKAMNLDGAQLIGAAAVESDDTRALITVTERGFAKRCLISEYGVQNRGGKGVICHKVSDRTGALCGIAAVEEDQEIMLMTDSGIIIRTRVDEIPVYGRAAAGVIAMRLDAESKVIGFAVVNSESESEETDSDDTQDVQETQETQAPQEV